MANEKVEDKCPHCGSCDTGGVTNPMFSLDAEDTIESLSTCFTCGEHFVVVSKRIKCIPRNESSRFRD